MANIGVYFWIVLTAWLAAIPGFVPSLVCGQEIPVKQLQEDFQIIRHALEEAHGGIYRYTSKADMDRTFDRAYRRIDHPMTALEFWRLAAPVVAHIKCGHTYLFFPKAVQTQMVTTLPLFPMVTRIFDDRLYGYQDLANAGSLLEGAELLSINGVPARKLLNSFRTVCYTGDGNAATAKDYRITHYGDFRFYLYGFGIESPFQVEYRDKGGQRHSTTLAGLAQSTVNQAWDARNSVLATAPNADFKFLDGDRIAVMTIRHWYRYADEDHKLEFSDFLKTSFAQIHEKGTTNLVIDVRDDDGGLDRKSVV